MPERAELFSSQSSLTNPQLPPSATPGQSLMTISGVLRCCGRQSFGSCVSHDCPRCQLPVKAKACGHPKSAIMPQVPEDVRHSFQILRKLLSTFRRDFASAERKKEMTQKGDILLRKHFSFLFKRKKVEPMEREKNVFRRLSRLRIKPFLQMKRNRD